jgi:hypothetical protein
VVPLALVEVAVAIAFLVLIALGEAVILLILLVSFISCFTWDRSWRVPALIMDPWKLSMKPRMRSSHESMEFVLRLSSQVRGADSRATGKWRALVELDPPKTSIATE